MSSINNSSTLHQINEMWAGYHTRNLNTEMTALRRQATDRAETLVNNIPMLSSYGGIRISDDGTFETTAIFHDGFNEIYDPELHAIVDKTLRGDEKLAEILGKIRDYEYVEHKAPSQSDTPSPLQQLDENGNPVASTSDEVLARMKANASIFQRSFLDHEMIAFPTGIYSLDLSNSERISTTVSTGGKQITTPDGDSVTISKEALALAKNQSKPIEGTAKDAEADDADLRQAGQRAVAAFKEEMKQIGIVLGNGFDMEVGMGGRLSLTADSRQKLSDNNHTLLTNYLDRLSQSMGKPQKNDDANVVKSFRDLYDLMKEKGETKYTLSISGNE